MHDFVPDANRRLRDNGLAKTGIVVFICRPGDRSSRGANRLAEGGCSRVYSVVDDFEGDMSPDGRRTVNSCKSTGMPCMLSPRQGQAVLSALTSRWCFGVRGFPDPNIRHAKYHSLII